MLVPVLRDLVEVAEAAAADLCVEAAVDFKGEAKAEEVILTNEEVVAEEEDLKEVEPKFSNL